MKTGIFLVKQLLESATQVRSEINSEGVRDIKEARKRGVKLPWPVVYDDGGEVYLADGFHRLTAYDELGDESVKCEIRKGSRIDAIRFAIELNKKHLGVRFTLADRKRSAQMLLTECPTLSDRTVGDEIGLDGKTVAAVRKSLVSLKAIPVTRKRIGKDNRSRRSPQSPPDCYVDAGNGLLLPKPGFSGIARTANSPVVFELTPYKDGSLFVTTIDEQRSILVDITLPDGVYRRVAEIIDPEEFIEGDEDFESFTGLDLIRELFGEYCMSMHVNPQALLWEWIKQTPLNNDFLPLVYSTEWYSGPNVDKELYFRTRGPNLLHSNLRDDEVFGFLFLRLLQSDPMQIHYCYPIQGEKLSALNRALEIDWSPESVITALRAAACDDQERCRFENQARQQIDEVAAIVRRWTLSAQSDQREPGRCPQCGKCDGMNEGKLICWQHRRIWIDKMPKSAVEIPAASHPFVETMLRFFFTYSKRADVATAC